MERMTPLNNWKLEQWEVEREEKVIPVKKNEQKYRRNSIEYGMNDPQVAKRAK